MTSQTSIGLRLLRLAAPIVGLNVLGVLSLAIDTAFAGALPEGAAALAALAVASQLVVFTNVMMMGLTVGTVSVVARAAGAGDTERVERAIEEATKLTVIAALTVAVAGNALASPILRALGARDPHVLALALAFVRPIFGGSVFYYGWLLLAASLRAIGSTILPFVVAAISLAIHVVLDLGLMFGRFGLPALGVAGAAWSTVIAQIVNVVLTVVSLRWSTTMTTTSIGDGEARVTLRFRAPFRLDRALAGSLLRVGLPAMLDLALVNLRFVALLFVLAPAGSAAIAAHGVGIRVQSLAFVPGLAISQATSALVGQALGRGRRDEARATARVAALVATALMTGLGAALSFAPTPILALFHVHPGQPSFDPAIAWMRILGLAMPLVGLQIALVGALRGAGATATSLRINLLGTFAFLVPLAVLLGPVLGGGAIGVWWSFPLSLLAMSVVTVLAYRRTAWDRAGTNP